MPAGHKLVIANLKMHWNSLAEAERYERSLIKDWSKLAAAERVRLAVCPSFPFVPLVKHLGKAGIALGVQDVFWENSGAYTGEVSPTQAAAFGAAYAIIGHSERREHLGETGEMVSRKAHAALAAHLTPVVCIGETREERDAETTLSVVREQLNELFTFVLPEDAARLVIAYEPRWAIGTDRTPTSDEILEVKLLIRKELLKLCGSAGEKTPILYGGSVRAEFVGSVCLDPGLDGVLVGRESLDPKSLIAICRALV